ncbi:MAG: hypothetical protein JWO31_1151 [Phycisphaerales bacterium]|nr:hypothetical protein [Phycisphaerales bacterium]
MPVTEPTVWRALVVVLSVAMAGTYAVQRTAARGSELEALLAKEASVGARLADQCRQNGEAFEAWEEAGGAGSLPKLSSVAASDVQELERLRQRILHAGGGW